MNHIARPNAQRVRRFENLCAEDVCAMPPKGEALAFGLQAPPPLSHHSSTTEIHTIHTRNMDTANGLRPRRRRFALCIGLSLAIAHHLFLYGVITSCTCEYPHNQDCSIRGNISRRTLLLEQIDSILKKKLQQASQLRLSP